MTNYPRNPIQIFSSSPQQYLKVFLLGIPSIFFQNFINELLQDFFFFWISTKKHKVFLSRQNNDFIYKILTELSSKHKE